MTARECLLLLVLPLAVLWWPALTCLVWRHSRRRAKARGDDRSIEWLEEATRRVLELTLPASIVFALAAGEAGRHWDAALSLTLLPVCALAVSHLLWWGVVFPRLRRAERAAAVGGAAGPAVVTPFELTKPGRWPAWFAPRFSGAYRPATLRPDLLPRVAERVRSGLWPMASPARNRYEVVEEGADLLRFRSTSLLTGIGLGLNDVSLRVEGDAIRYDVGMKQWLGYCVGLGAAIGIPLAAVYVLGVVTGNPWLLKEIGLSEGSRTWAHVFVISQLVFWCLLWPWILLALQRFPAAGALHRLLDELNAPVGEITPPAGG